ncbi:MAG: hypothetical protein ACOVSR_01400 [Bacteroidia bacterium]
MKYKLPESYSQWMNDFKSHHSFIVVIVIEVFLFVIGFSVGNLFKLFSIDRAQSIEILKETLSNYISLLGIGLAVLAILLTIIQFSYKRLSIVKLVLDNTYFTPLFYFGVVNILISSILYLFCNDEYFITNHIFIRSVVILNYHFFLLIFFLGVVFTLTFKYVDYSKITELYLKDLKFLISKEKNQINDESFREVLQVKSNELKNEVEANIQENKITVIDKIFDLYQYTYASNPSSIVVQYLRFNINKWILNSYLSENYIVFHNLIQNWFKLYKAGLDSNDVTRMSLIKHFASEIYLDGVFKKNATIKKLVIDTFPIRLKENAQILIWNNSVKDNDKIEENITELNIRLEPILSDFNELIHVIALDNNKNLELVLNELRMLEELSDLNSDYREFAFRLSFTPEENETSNNLTASEQLKYNYIANFYRDSFSIKFGNLSWLYYECFVGRKLYSELTDTIGLLERSINIDPTSFLRQTIQLLSSPRHKYNWSEWIWKSEDRLSGKTYTLENEESFLSLGFLILIIKKNVSINNLDSLSTDDIQKSESLIYFSNGMLAFYKSKTTLWQEILGIETPEALELAFGNLRDFLAGIKNIKERNYLKELVSEPISQSKVQAFKNEIEAQWNESRNVDILFEYFDSVILNPKSELKFIGQGRINFQKAKFLFVDKLHQNMYGIEWGHEVCRQIHNYLISKILQNSSIERKEVKDISEALEHASSFVHEEDKLNVMFIAFSSWYLIERDLSSSGNFIASRIEENKQYPFKYLGVYKNNLIVIPVHSDLLAKSFVAFNLPKAINLLRRTNDAWIKNKLQLDIIEITDEEAHRILERKGLNEPYSQDDVLETKAGIIIELGETIDFEFKNIDLVKSYYIGKE